MSSSNLIRWGGVAAILGSVLGVAIAPVITSAYSLAEGEPGQAPLWEPALSSTLSPLFSFASPQAVYATYGRLYLLIFACFLLGLLALRALRRNRDERLEKWGLRLSLFGVILNLLGNLGDYWYRGGMVDSTPDFLGFLLGTVVGLLVLYIGSVMLGVALLRDRTASRLGAWLLILALPGAVLLNFLGFGNLPSGPTLWFCLAWLVLGYYMTKASNRVVGRAASAQ